MKFWKRTAILFSQGSMINEKVAVGFLYINTQRKSWKAFCLWPPSLRWWHFRRRKQPLNIPFPEFACNFDVSTCNFVQDTDDDFDWTRQKGSTPSSNTGPSSDHTSGSGWLTKKFNCSPPGDWVNRSIRYFSSVNFWYQFKRWVMNYFTAFLSYHQKDVISILHSLCEIWLIPLPLFVLNYLCRAALRSGVRLVNGRRMKES